MPSRQERRKAERDAAKRAPAQAGAAGAAAALANITLNPTHPGGDWTTQAADPSVLFRAVGPEILKRRARDGDREAQWTLGMWSVREADGGAREGLALGTGGRSPKAEAGLALRTARFPVAH